MSKTYEGSDGFTHDKYHEICFRVECMTCNAHQECSLSYEESFLLSGRVNLSNIPKLYDYCMNTCRTCKNDTVSQIINIYKITLENYTDMVEFMN